MGFYMLKRWLAIAQGKETLSSKRSSRWPDVRRKFIESEPNCNVCGGRYKLEVHHIIPYHIDPALELDPNNLISLCESNFSGVNCHLFFGHLGNYRMFNPHVIADANIWNEKLFTHFKKYEKGK
jgi:hypothetical protein